MHLSPIGGRRLSPIAPDVGSTCDGVVSEKEGCAGSGGAQKGERRHTQRGWWEALLQHEPAG
jgi:hypothetical protein